MSDNDQYTNRFYIASMTGKKGNLFTRVEALENALKRAGVKDITNIISTVINENKEIILPSVYGGVADPTDPTFSGVVLSPSGQMIDGVLYSYAWVVDGVVIQGMGDDGSPVVVGGTPAGADTQIQYNDGGAFGADANFTWDKTNRTLQIQSYNYAILGIADGESAGISIYGGDQSEADNAGGQMFFVAGNGNGTGGGGIAGLVGGVGGDTGDGGNANLVGGQGGATSGNGGLINLVGGNAVLSGNGGNVEIAPGAGAGAGVDGITQIYSDVNLSAGHTYQIDGVPIGGGAGDVIGDSVPSTDDNIVTYNGTDGKHIQDSGVAISSLLTDAPSDTYMYGRKDAAWTSVQISDVGASGAGDDVCVNGGFDADTDWTKSDGTIEITGGKAVFTASDGTLTAELPPCEVNEFYFVQYDLVVTSGGVSSIPGENTYYASKLVTELALAQDENLQFMASGFTGTIDNLAVYKMGLPYTLGSFVDTSSDESISGIKTFLSIPRTSGGDPTLDNELATKKYVDDNAGGTYTDEMAQDAVGGMVADTATIDLTYTDATPELKADVKDGSITYAKMQDVSATSRVLGRITAGSGDVEELTGANVLSIAGAAPTASPTFTGTVILPKAIEIQDTSADHQYVLAVSELTADRTVTLPLLTGSDTFVFGAHTQTLTNKRVTPRTDTVASSATPTINTDNVDYFSITALAANITSMTTNLSGTPTAGQRLWISIIGTATRTIAWGTSFESSTISLPTTTVSTARLDVGFVWNEASSKWRCVGVA